MSNDRHVDSGSTIPGTFLTYVSEASRTDPRKRKCVFQCSCGNRTIALLEAVRRKRIISCGCDKIERITETGTEMIIPGQHIEGT